LVTERQSAEIALFFAGTTMNYFPVTFVLMAVTETLLAAVMSGVNHLTDGQEIEENLIISRRRAISEHDHRTDSAYAGILSKLHATCSLLSTRYSFYFT